MANCVLTLDVLSNAFLHLLGKRLQRLGTATYVDNGSNSYRQGDTVMLREPLSFKMWGPGVPDPAEVFQSSRQPVVLQHQVSVGFEFDSVDLVFTADQFMRRHLEPAAEMLADKVARLWPLGADLVTAAMLSPPNVMQAKHSTSIDSGLSVRCVMDYDAAKDVYQFRADMLFGFTGQEVQAQTQWEYTPSYAEAEMIVLLMEARASFATQLETLKRAA